MGAPETYGHPPEVGQTPVGLLSYLALVWQHMAVSKLPTTPGNSSSVSKPLRVPAQDSRVLHDDKSPFSLFPKFHLSPCENTRSFLFTEGFYSRNLFARQFFWNQPCISKTINSYSNQRQVLETAIYILAHPRI